MVCFYEADYNNQIGDMPMIDVINMRLKFKNWLTNRLKFIRPSWKPSEQEKGALRTAIHILTEERNFPKAAAQLQNILVAFEGKESRKDWKPSEEQMKALYCALNDAISLYSDKVSPLYEEISRTHFDALESLYNDLKKLI